MVLASGNNRSCTGCICWGNQYYQFHGWHQRDYVRLFAGGSGAAAAGGLAGICLSVPGYSTGALGVPDCGYCGAGCSVCAVYEEVLSFA